VLLSCGVSRRITGLQLELLLKGALYFSDGLGGVIIIGGRRRGSGSFLCSGAWCSWLGAARSYSLGGRWSIRFSSALDGGLRFLVGLLVGLAHESLCTLFEGTTEAVPLEVETRGDGRGLAGAFRLGTSPGFGWCGVVDLK
jgi:hypothetical protein